ncbi:hypothetical protein OE88DRAFT_914987 [Heliocybe sulcata]|uniref:Uncharacterized protein n=1 Tax=Heliocybe sulcata TaxID=5364 RepID=A0A5C3MNP3_9AGAM|nr:hypothetical protein OE88DRAFT_914987 [Heliocybe sulcata]
MSSSHRPLATRPETRHWTREHFYDHPKLFVRHADAYVDDRFDKPKVYCKICFDRRVRDELAKNEVQKWKRLSLLFRNQMGTMQSGQSCFARPLPDVRASLGRYK